MAVDYVSYSGKSNVGFNMKTNEDYILFNESDFGDCLFTSIADGSGAKNGTFRPSSIAVHQTETFLKRLYNKNTQLLLDNSKLFITIFNSVKITIFGKSNKVFCTLFNSYMCIS